MGSPVRHSRTPATRVWGFGNTRRGCLPALQGAIRGHRSRLECSLDPSIRPCGGCAEAARSDPSGDPIGIPLCPEISNSENNNILPADRRAVNLERREYAGVGVLSRAGCVSPRNGREFVTGAEYCGSRWALHYDSGLGRCLRRPDRPRYRSSGRGEPQWRSVVSMSPRALRNVRVSVPDLAVRPRGGVETDGSLPRRPPRAKWRTRGVKRV